MSAHADDAQRSVRDRRLIDLFRLIDTDWRDDVQLYRGLADLGVGTEYRVANGEERVREVAINSLTR